MKTLGVIGGVGPLATFYFGKIVVERTDVYLDQDHIPMIILNDVLIPDRTSYLLGKSMDSPVSHLIKDIKFLNDSGVDCIALLCNTAMAFIEELRDNSDVEVINIIEETILKLASEGVKKFGLLSTEGTKKIGLYNKYSAMHGLECINLDDEHQTLCTSIIYDQVKANRPVSKQYLDQCSNYLKSMGAEKIVLGCTEISTVKDKFNLDATFIDSLEVLADKSIELCSK